MALPEGAWRKVEKLGGRVVVEASIFLELYGKKKVSGLYPYPSLDLCTDPDGCTSCSAVNRLT